MPGPTIPEIPPEEIVQSTPNTKENGPNNINLTIKEPPLKKLKNRFDKLTQTLDCKLNEIPELSPKSLKVSLAQEELLFTGLNESSSKIACLHETVLEKWRKTVLPISPLPPKEKPAQTEPIVESTKAASNLFPDIESNNHESPLRRLSGTKFTEGGDGGLGAIEDLSDGFFSDTEFTQKPKTEVESQYDFDFGNISDIDDMISSEPFQVDLKPKQFRRLKIAKITESHFTQPGRIINFPERILECLELSNDRPILSQLPFRVHVRGDWLHCRFAEESIVNVVGNFQGYTMIIDDERNYLITEPDCLISTTVLADSFACLRRSVLSYRTQPSIEDNKPSVSLICGSISHELVEDAFRTGNFNDEAAVLGKLDQLISDNIEDIFCCDNDEKFVKARVKEIMSGFPEWCKLYLRRYPAIHAYVQDQLRKTGNSSEKQTVAISKVIDLEENIWSVMFGIKGKVDATVLMRYRDNAKKDYVDMVIPFELKTGTMTTSVSHRAQTLLYTLLLQDRYSRPVDYALLFYVATGDLVRIAGFRDDIKSIVIARNRLAEELSFPDQLPQQISNEHLCKKCFQMDSCVIYHKLAENGRKETSSVPSIFDQKTSHLDRPEYIEFFKKWQRLITLEEVEVIGNRSELWRQSAETSAKYGRCFKDMILIESAAAELKGTSLNRYRTVFRQKEPQDKIKSSLLNVQIGEGDPVVVSLQENDQYGLGIGFVHSVTETEIVLFTDRPVRAPLKSDFNFESDINNAFGQLIIHPKPDSDTLFRIDKNELSSSFGLLRANIYRLFRTDSAKLLDLVVNLKKPVFSPEKRPDNRLLERHNLLDDFNKMDSFQQQAFFQSIRTLDYLLILGMPGTGKTTTLSFIIQYLTQVMAKTVIISSHTHSSIDHIALKLQERGVKYIRVGTSDRIDKNISEEALLCKKTFSTVAEVDHFYSSAQVVICTSLGINHPIFSRKRFDYCIVDEASQLTLPSCVGPLRLANSFILVGDHFQLPPLVRNKEALKDGLGVSLFKRLAEAHPDAMALLRNQYRMNEDIMAVSNRLVYSNLLQCGSEVVKKYRLECPLFSKVKCGMCGGFDGHCWVHQVLLEDRKVIFLDTDSCDAFETSNGSSFHNEIEAKIIELIVKSAITAGINANQLSLISPYRPQLKHMQFPAFPDVEVSTIDKYQGRDKDCTIISLVRSNINGNIGELLNDWQRLNVAFTRAKKKLILVGSRGTVLGNKAFRVLEGLLLERNWILKLPQDALAHQIHL